MTTRRCFFWVGILVCCVSACSGSKVVFLQDPNSPQLDGDAETATDGDTVPPADGDAVPPTDGDAVPPTDGDAVPPADGDEVPPTDGDTVPPVDGDTVPPVDGDTVPPIDGDTSEVPDDDGDAVRQAVEGTNGFCTTRGTPGLGCTHDSDCTTYLRATTDVNCYVGAPVFIEFSSACNVAAAQSLPAADGSDCHADDLCKDLPRACVNGQCKDTSLKEPCDISSDCELKDYGCACMAFNIFGRGAPALSFGHDCPAFGGCGSGAKAVCVRGYCSVAGAFMDPTIESYCRKEISYLGNNPSVGSGTLVCGTPNTVSARDLENCENYYKEENYTRAVTYWPMLLTGSTAQTCEGFIHGAWSEMHPCPVTP